VRKGHRCFRDSQYSLYVRERGQHFGQPGAPLNDREALQLTLFDFKKDGFDVDDWRAVDRCDGTDPQTVC
jgi:hypothetical protein